MYVVIFIAILVAVSGFFAPVPPGFPNAQYAHPFLAMSGLVTVIQIGAAVFFLLSLRTFKLRLQVAYMVLSAGMVLFSLAQLQFPLIVSAGALGWVWLEQGLIIVPYALASVSVYVSMRLFAGASGVRLPRWLTPSILVGSGVIGYLVGLLPRIEQPVTSNLRVYVALLVVFGLFSAATVLATRRVRVAIGGIYSAPMKWLLFGFVTMTFEALNEMVNISTIRVDSFYTGTAISTWPLLLMSLFLLCAGASFRKIVASRPADNASDIDVIMYTAQLVSDQKAIDPILDTVRTITARASTNSTLAADDKAALIEVYTQIEDYLISSEKLRNFTRSSLRSQLPKSFLSKLPPV